ncbi:MULTISPECIES: FadR/GntR family transcriptional regulator [Novosphingobium]|jgi:GntR family transcriptional regulator, hexuronate regulon transcriptional repressor|uniref:GntR family transcriptional regulator n=2 Tax=Novosphingobium subterraneum TaxID=48936 RepID=A0A0B9A6M9_9SPHN|nr:MULTISPECIES: FadR/GntR family transcriptional regulator [Novosphingobium]KHS44956.1 GntR family transcriptional regulator [Novosphingobium subterraneum]KHS44965.1 GntR family transcriptional regulator [Novosphingobium subterraneum]QOV95642.1 FadR family transcriptional regulator [Novosphingobium sp. ES2-1]QOV95649.1 FadR family transcriptional regulator [Novosphingobium sp. ES2-1]
MTTGKSHDRLYQDLARSLLDELASGRYPVGSRLPAERDLALRYEVSRPTVREAIIALEVQGLVEVRVGSGAYVKRLPGENDRPGFNVTAFELTEARLLFEGEAAALAATQMTDEDLAEIEVLVQQIAEENRSPNGTETADRAFHLAIAKATRNVAVYNTVAQLWDLRGTSPEAALLHEKARHANIKPVVEEHTAILEALRARDPNAARTAMRTHLSAVLDGLLFATEERLLAEARRATQAKRDRYAKATA